MIEQLLAVPHLGAMQRSLTLRLRDEVRERGPRATRRELAGWREEVLASVPLFAPCDCAECRARKAG